MSIILNGNGTSNFSSNIANDGTVAFGSSAFNLDSSGNIGINSTIPRSKLDVVGDLSISNSNNQGDIHFYQYGTTNEKALIRMDQISSTAGNLQFWTENSSTLAQRVTVTSGGDLEINDGNLKIAAFRGIDFSANSDAGRTVTANVLDDYEEGTWTPQYSGRATNGTITNNRASNAEYVKVGNQVTVSFDIDQTLTGATGDWQILGLPFTTHTGPYFRSTGTIAFANPGTLTWSGSPLLYANDGGNSVWGIQNNSGAAYSFLTAVNSRMEVWGVLTYFID